MTRISVATIYRALVIDDHTLSKQPIVKSL